MTKPLISIIIPTYNAEKFIDDALKSIAQQTFKSIEVVIIDNFSKDKTTEIIEKCEHLFKLEFIQIHDNGIYDAMNIATRKASGKFFLFMGCDDVLHNEGVLQQTSTRLVSDNTIYYFNTWFKSRDKLYDGRFTKFKLAVRNISHQAILYPANVFTYYNYDLKCKLLADYKLNIQLFNSKKYHFCYNDYCISIYNDLGSSGKNIDIYFESIKPKLVRKYLGFWPFVYLKIRRIAKYIIKHK